MFKVSWIFDFLLGPRLYMDSGDSTPAETTQTSISELPEWARGYAKDTLAKASALTDINKNPYQQYGGQRIAGFTPLQEQTFQTAAGMQPSQQLGLGTSLAGTAGLGALGTNYRAGQFYGGQFNQPTAEQYMDPYMQSVVDYQKGQALRDYQIAQPMRQAQAVRQGAFGGSRSAIMDAEAQRALNAQLQGIEATGRQSAFQNAQQQFNADMARNLQAQQLREQSRQYGAGLGMQGLQTGLQAAGQLGQLGQTQYGQQMGITQLQSQLGAQQQAQAQRPLDVAYQDFLNQQNYPYKQLGFMSDMIRGLPLGQQSTAQMYQAPPSTLQTVGALGLGAYGVNQLMKNSASGGLASSYAGGGMVAFRDGGDTDIAHSPMDDPAEMAQAVSKLSDEQLQQIIQHPSSAAELQAAKTELATRASESRGLASAYNVMPQQAPQQTPQAPMVQAARGGIMAFAGDDESLVTDEDEKKDELLAALGLDQLSNVTGDPAQQKVWNQKLSQAFENISNYQPRTMTEDQRRANTLANYKEIQAMAGPSPYEAQERRIAELEGQRAGNLEQQKGLAALAAIPSILKGGNAVRGLGEASGTISNLYGKALQADREEKRSLMSMRNNLEDAQYKMRVGMIGDARQLTAEARRDAQAADAASIAKQKALGVLAAQGVRLNAPPKPTAQKFEPSDSRALTMAVNDAKRSNPQKKGESDADYQARVEGIGFRDWARETKQQRDITSKSTVTSSQLQEKGPNVLTSGAESTESAEMLAGIKAFEDMNKSYNKNSRAIVKKYMDENDGDFAKAARAYAQSRITPKAATSGVNKPAAPAAAPAAPAAPASTKPTTSALPPGAPAGSTLGKFVQGKGTEVIKDGKVIGYAN